MHKKNGNIFDELPQENLAEEIIEPLLQTKRFKLERIISTGQQTPKDEWYDQAQDEWVILLKGNASLLFDDGEELTLQTGDYVFISAHRKHQVSWTSTTEPCVWLALHINDV